LNKIPKGEATMGQIKSSAISAGSAISELVGVDTSNAQNQ
jgi:hypothetical protein